jgi:ketosteroid isomerase-like protein
MGNLQILKDGYEAFGRGDVPSVLAIFDPNAEWRRLRATLTSLTASPGSEGTPSSSTSS